MNRQDIYNFVVLLRQNKDYQLFSFKDNSLYYNGRSLDLVNFNLDYFLQNNPNFKNDIANLTPDAIFDIIKIHVVSIKQKQNNMLNDNFLTNLAEKFPTLKHFHLVVNEDKINNISKKYIHYKDKYNNNHILDNLSVEELIKIYKDLVMSKGSNVDEEELFNKLKENHREIPMEDLITAQMRPNASSEHLNHLTELNEENNRVMDALDTPIGNEEEKIYLSHGKVYTYNLNKDKQEVKESHEGNENDDNLDESKTIEIEKVKLITFEEYENLILNSIQLTEEEKKKINTYESFLADVVLYKDYLTSELYTIYNKFCMLNNYIYNLKETTDIIEDAKKRYDIMFTNSENNKLTKKEDKELVLTRINEKYNTGSISLVIFIILVTLFLGILIALFILS